MKFTVSKIMIVCSAFILLSIILRLETKPKMIITPPLNTQYNTIIFDLGGVLLTTNSKIKTWIIAKTMLTNPTLLYRLINFDTKKEYFDFLHTLPAQNTQTMYMDNQPLPAIFVNWQLGHSDTMYIKSLINDHLQNTDYPIAIKNLFLAIAELMFTPTLLSQSQMPIIKMVDVLESLKDAGYKIYALTNWDPESFNDVKQAHDFFDHFDGIVVSGYEQTGKPEQSFFQILIDRYNINPATAIFIDDEPKNTHAAQCYGIAQTITCTSTQDVIDQLENLGILTQT